MKKLRRLLLATILPVLAQGCDKKDKTPVDSNDLTLKRVGPEGVNPEENQVPQQEWVSGQSTDGKTLTLDITYRPQSAAAGISLVPTCLTLLPDEQVGERKCNGQVEAIRVKNLKIICSGIGEGPREPLEKLAACPGSSATRYTKFNFPVVFTVE